MKYAAYENSVLIWRRKKKSLNVHGKQDLIVHMFTEGPLRLTLVGSRGGKDSGNPIYLASVFPPLIKA